jgi:anti-anti-sigma factor
MAGSFRILVFDDGYALDGELDAATAGEVRKLSASLDGLVVRIDLSGLTFVDSSGLHALLDMKRAHPTVRLIHPSPQMQRLAELTSAAVVLFDP